MGRFCCLSDSHGEGHDSNCINYPHTKMEDDIVPPNEVTVLVKYEGKWIKGKAIWGRDGTRPHWELENGISIEPKGIRQWRLLENKKQIPTSGYDSLFEKFMNEYKELMYEIQTFAMKMPLKTLQMACEVSMNALVVLQDQFKKRFPTEFDAWNKQFED